MSVQKRQPVLGLRILAPKLEKFSDRQIEVAQTWALHFSVPPSRLTSFIETYLSSTAHTRCWCVTLPSTSDQTQPVLARIGDHLQYFDGHQVKACKITSKDRVHKKKPTALVAQQLLLRFEKRWYADALLTSFCKSAGERAQALSIEDLGGSNRSGYYSTVSNNRYFNPRNRFYLKQIGSTLKQFCRCLDQELLFAIRSAQCPSPKLYNWLAQGDRKRRLQALKAQPVLIPLMVLVDQWPWPWDGQQQVYMTCPWDDLQECRPNWSGDGSLINAQECLIGRIADAGLPLNDTLAWLLQTPRTAVRYLGQQRVFDTGSALTRINREGPERPWHRLLLGASLGNRRPLKKAHWITFFALLDKIPYQLRDQTQDWNRLLSGCPTDWSDPSWSKIADDLRDLNELFNNIDESYGPDACEALHKLKSFIGTATYHQIASLVDGFHLAMIGIREALDAADPQTQTDSLTPWRTLLNSNDPLLVSPNGLQIVELKCPADLYAEHRALGHCIDGYDYSAYRGNCRLMSVRENGKSLASAEIQMDESAWGETLAKLTPKHLVTIQLRGHKNRTPKSGSRVDRAYQWFWAKIKSGELAINLEWPDQTLSMSRYTNRNRKKMHAQACAKWINLRLSKT
ncbi:MULTISPECIES: hypothetical protein [unclassified Pseudomonas]|uniref:hypothetical protein n=1 Tax=unclassified Pseudomonas TaxID=196821 RepID=UPI0004B295B5|nr:MULTISPECIES: hypothetical protein [unclassified Pseudomonas]SMF20415.1 hypothetical protein SAMN05660912_02080 [Pseudomonas sp. LAMO17WK12:I1]